MAVLRVPLARLHSVIREWCETAPQQPETAHAADVDAGDTMLMALLGSDTSSATWRRIIEVQETVLSQTQPGWQAALPGR